MWHPVQARQPASFSHQSGMHNMLLLRQAMMLVLGMIIFSSLAYHMTCHVRAARLQLRLQSCRPELHMCTPGPSHDLSIISKGVSRQRYEMGTSKKPPLEEGSKKLPRVGGMRREVMQALVSVRLREGSRSPSGGKHACSAVVAWAAQGQLRWSLGQPKGNSGAAAFYLKCSLNASQSKCSVLPCTTCTACINQSYTRSSSASL